MDSSAGNRVFHGQCAEKRTGYHQLDRPLHRLAGQALAYKVGQMKILELQATARQALGPKFDIREFHDVVLSTGAVPLSVLERVVQRWLAAKQATSTKP